MDHRPQLFSYLVLRNVSSGRFFVSFTYNSTTCGISGKSARAEFSRSCIVWIPPVERAIPCISAHFPAKIFRKTPSIYRYFQKLLILERGDALRNHTHARLESDDGKCGKISPSAASRWVRVGRLRSHLPKSDSQHLAYGYVPVPHNVHSGTTSGMACPMSSCEKSQCRGTKIIVNEQKRVDASRNESGLRATEGVLRRVWAERQRSASEALFLTV